MIMISVVRRISAVAEERSTRAHTLLVLTLTPAAGAKSYRHWREGLVSQS